MLIPILLALAGCGESEDLPPPPDPPTAGAAGAPSDGDTAASADDTAGDTSGADSGLLGDSYSNPSYSLCVTDAECAPGDACTTVPGYAGQYCAPACDAAGDGAECDVEGIDFGTTCTEHNRCARTCDAPPEGDTGASTDDCPEGLACVDVDGQGVCAGDVAALSGYYGICTHPNVDGTDCPEDASCVGGDLIGIEDGICLPWCPDYTCPDPEGDVDNVTPYCYDVGLGDPVCALLCTPGDSVCPTDQECFSLYGSVGICAPPDAENPF